MIASINRKRPLEHLVVVLRWRSLVARSPTMKQSCEERMRSFGYFTKAQSNWPNVGHDGGVADFKNLQLSRHNRTSAI